MCAWADWACATGTDGLQLPSFAYFVMSFAAAADGDSPTGSQVRLHVIRRMHFTEPASYLFVYAFGTAAAAWCYSCSRLAHSSS